MTVSRRHFLAQSATLAAGALAAAAIGQADDKQAAPSPIVDCHQHLWDLSKFKLPWLGGAPTLNRSFVMDDYRKAIDGTGIARAVYMEVDVAPEQKQAEADYLIDLCRGGKTPTVAAVVRGHPGAEGFRKYAGQFEGSPYIRGFRQVLHGESTPPGTCIEKDFVRNVQQLGEMNLSFDLCTRPAEMADGVRLVEACPDTLIILDHCGNADVNAFLPENRRQRQEPAHTPDHWKKHIAAFAAKKNVVCKISGIVARVPQEWSAEDLAPIVNHCLDEFGPDRVVFGSDWPVCLLGAPLDQWVSALREIIASRPAEEQSKLLHDNAVRIYRLKDTPS